jgi:hypothetical protein
MANFGARLLELLNKACLDRSPVGDPEDANLIVRDRGCKLDISNVGVEIDDQKLIQRLPYRV